jgi:hypothetical protein
MPDASISLGLNAAEMYGELKTAEGRYAAGMDRMGNSTNQLSRSHDSLLKSNARVSSQFAHFFSIAASGGDSMSLLAGGIEAAAHAMKLSLGLTAAGYVGGLAIQKIVEMRAEWHKLNEELDRAAKPRDPLSTKSIEDDIKDRKDVVDKATPAEKIALDLLKKLAEVYNKNRADSFAGPRMSGELPVEVQNQGEFAVQKWLEAHGKGGAGFKPDTSWSTAMKKGADKKLDDHVDPGVRYERKVAAVRERIAQLEEQEATAKRATADAKRQESKKESMQLTLEDLAKNGREWAPGMDTRAGAGRQAREALKEEALSRKAMLGEHWDEALQHRDRADQIKNGISTLKDSDKDQENAVQRGLDSSAILRKIERNTAQPIVGKP